MVYAEQDLIKRERIIVACAENPIFFQYDFFFLLNENYIEYLTFFWPINYYFPSFIKF